MVLICLFHSVDDKSTLEHLECGEPYLDELKEQGFKVVEPDWNLNRWLILMKPRYLLFNFTAPVVAYISSLLVLRKVNNPPFWGAYLIYGQDEQVITIKG